jgi:hypothetical protein
MKIRIIFAIFCVLVITPAVFAQTTIKLFDPVNITDRGLDTTAYSFGTKSVYLSCPVGATAILSGPEVENGNLIVDNNFLVNGMNICPGGCFSGTYDNPYYHIDQPVRNAYLPVAPIDISSLLTAGVSQYTFNLMDYGYIYGSSEVSLITTCTQVEGYPVNQQGYAVCHRDYGKREQKTIYVGSQNAVQAHLNHGDTLGPCANGQ